MKTYLQLVNLVLQNLREDAVGSVSTSVYSSLIGSWINRAKTMVEDSTRWRRLIQPTDVTILSSVQSYDLGISNRSTLERSVINENLPMAFDITSTDPFQLIDQPYHYILEHRALLSANPSNQQKPINFSISKTEDSVRLDLWEVPTSTRNWRLYFCQPQIDLNLDSDTMKVPYLPVVDLATLWALNERGEEIGEPGTTVEQRVHSILSDAVAIDGTDTYLAFVRA